MDGQRKECEIIPNVAAQLNFNGSSFLVAANCDSIQMFPDPRYTYLRVWDCEEQTLKALFLDEDVLAELMDFGIPVTIRENITESEHESWVRYMGQVAMVGIDAEIDELLN